MKETNIWIRSRNAAIKSIGLVKPEMDIGFDSRVPKEVQDELLAFVGWVEKNFNIPITIWVDFEYKHYLVKKDGQRVGYIFYWTEFSDYPNFGEKDCIPEIRLPVRTEYWTIEEVLISFIEALTNYFAWICDELTPDFLVDEDSAEEVLCEYLKSREE